MFYVSVLLVGRVVSQQWWLLEFSLNSVFFLRDRVDNDHGKCTLTKQLLSRADPAHEPYLKLMKYFLWNFIFHNKKVQAYYFFFLLQKGKLLPEKQVIFSVLFFLPTQRILNYSVCLMLILGTNRRRCSWKKPLLRITSSDTLCSETEEPETSTQEGKVVLHIWHLASA